MHDAPRLHDPLAFQGRLEMHLVESRVLRDNPLGDPWRRELPLLVPAGADGPLPLLVCLTGFTGRGQKLLDTHPWKPGLALRLDRAMASGACPRALVAFPDCFTALGGSQYVNSDAVGRYEDHVADELIPLVERQHDVLPGARGVFGKSSGGFGALHLSMHRPGLFRAVGSISGDCAFEYGYASEFLDACRGLVPHGGDPARFLEAFRAEPKLSGDAHAVVNSLAMAACYSPNPASPLGFDLPFDPRTGERVPAVWERWLRFDPLEACVHHVDALRALDLLHLEAGLKDEFHLQFGSRLLSRRLTELGVPHDHEEFPGGHFGIDERSLVLVPKLVRALTARA